MQAGLFATSWWVAASTLAVAQDEPFVSERQAEAVISRAERQLISGQAKRVLQTTRDLSAVFFSSGETYEKFIELWDRAVGVDCTAIVRLAGKLAGGGRQTTDPHAELVQAETRLRELRDTYGTTHPTWISRHGEALVALGDRMTDAYNELAALHANRTLSEPEGYAALAVAAGATGHADIADAAREHCRALAKARARKVCLTQ